MEQENINTKFLDKLAPNGIWIFILLTFITFLMEKALDWVWLNYASLIILLIYVVCILDNIYNPNRKPILNLEKKLLVGNFLIIPCILVLIITGLYALLLYQADGSKKLFEIFWAIFINSQQLSMLIFMFSCFVVMNFFRGYEREKIFDTPVTVEYVQQIHANEEENKKGIDNLVSKLEKMENVLENKREMSYTATCIPVRYNAEHDTIVFVLVKNESHTKSQWMFPGSHVEVSSNDFSNKELPEVEVIPSKVIRDKTKNEAGLEKLYFLDPNYKYVNPEEFLQAGEEEYQYPNTCWPVEAPVFNYLFRVSDEANCSKQHFHKCHYDFTYVAEYEEVNSEIAKYDVIEIEFNLKQMDLKNEARKNDIGKIKTKLEDNINKKLRKEQRGTRKQLNIPLDELCLDSIPQMIYNTILFYKDYKGL